MNPYIAYEAVNTKIISKRGHLLDQEQWRQIFGFTSIEQLAEFLKNNTEVLKELAEDNVHRQDLEAVLNKYKTREIENLIHYVSGPYKSFVKTMFLQSEITDLSVILRKIARKESLDGIQDNFVHSEKYSNIPYDKLLSSNSVVQFTENLKDTLYFNELRNLTNEDAIKREFHIEMKLQLILYNELLSKAENLEKADMIVAKDIIGYKIDLENVQWIYRATSYYEISPEEILNYCLMGGRKINYYQLKKLCYTKSKEEFMKLANSYLRFDFFEDVNSENNSISIDRYMFNYLKNTKFDGIGSVIAYVTLVGIIIDDLTTVTEGIKYHISKEKIKEYLAIKI